MQTSNKALTCVSQEQRAEEQAAAAEEAAAAWQGIVQGAWPFGAMCEQACLDVLAPDWETRHGAAVALREVLRSHAASAGVNMPLAPEPSGGLFICSSLQQLSWQTRLLARRKQASALSLTRSQPRSMRR